MSDDVKTVHCFAIFYLSCIFVYHLHLLVWVIRGFFFPNGCIVESFVKSKVGSVFYYEDHVYM